MDYFNARYYSSAQGRFTSPDPLYITSKRLVDPQQLNIYSYTRNNPLKFIDPSGLDITVNGWEMWGYLDRLQQATPSFKITYDANNKVIIIDKNGKALDKKALNELGKSLKGGEKQLFKAITDTNNHVTVNAVRSDNNVLFGAFASRGQGQTLDIGDIERLDSKKNAGGLTGAQVVAHETLEAYAASKGAEFDEAHEFANKFFGGINAIDGTTKAYADPNNPNMAAYLYTEYSIVGNKGTRAAVFLQLDTPIPMNSVQQRIASGVPISGNVVAMEKKP